MPVVQFIVPPSKMGECLLSLPADLMGAAVFPLLSPADLTHLNSACCSKTLRDELEAITRTLKPVNLGGRRSVHQQHFSDVVWLVKNNIKILYVDVCTPQQLRYVAKNANIFDSVGVTSPIILHARQHSRIFSKITRWLEDVDHDAVATSGVELLHHLQYVSIHYTEESADVVPQVIRNNDRLEDLTLICCTHPRDSLWTAVALRGDTLLRLYLAGFNTITSEHVARIGQNCPHLEDFELDPVHDDQNNSSADMNSLEIGDWLVPVAHGCPDLRQLAIVNAWPSDHSVEQLLQHCSKLYMLCMGEASLGDSTLLAVASRNDFVSAVPITDLRAIWCVWSLEAVQTCEHLLRKLDSVYFSQLDSLYVKTLVVALELMGNLREFTLAHGRDGVEWKVLAGLAKGCKALRYLEISPHRWSEPEATKAELSEAVGDVLVGCQELEDVNLEGLHINDATLVDMAGSGGGRNLRRLRCAASSVTDLGLTAVAMSCTRLHSLRLGGTVLITDVALKALATYCPDLTCLWLWNCEPSTRLTVAGLTELFVSCRHLKDVYINPCTLTAAEVDQINRVKVPGRRKIAFKTARDDSKTRF
jgi:hypothetical protein